MERFNDRSLREGGWRSYIGRKPDLNAEVGRIPICMLIDTSGSMRPHS